MKNSALIANPFKGNEPFYMDFESFYGSFCNTLEEEDARKAYEEYATHDSRNVLRECMGEAGEVNLDIPHAPFLFIGGSEDQIIPPALNEKSANAYTHELSITDFKEFAQRSHFICGEPGWHEVAEYTAEWLQNQHEKLHVSTI